MKRILGFSLLLTFLIFPARSFAFNPNYIISDADLLDPYALTRDQIQHFLDRGFLGDYVTEDHEGIERSAADIIMQTAINVGISPKFLLVLLQKEQSLVEDDDPTDRQLDWATGYAVCDSCSKDDPAIQRWKGFGKQVNSAALQYVEGYLEDIEKHGTTGPYGPGVEVEVDGEIVMPANAATAAMYAYTPHLHGNQVFVEIWNRWFQTLHPTGTLLQAEGQSGVWLVEYGTKRPIRSMSALMSRFNPDLIVTVSETQLANYPEGRPIDFPNYSLLKDQDGNIYLLTDESLRHIDSMETFRKIGFSIDEVVDILNEDVFAFSQGDPITAASLDPKGNLLQLETNGAVFFVQDGFRHAILDRAILDAVFPNQTPEPVLPVVVEQYREGTPVLFPDGFLVKSTEDPTVYVISEGEKRPIPSEEVFTAYGWEWQNIVTTTEGALKQHETGAVIETPTFLDL